MPLKLNIGLSRKVGEPNYGSRGASINVEMEVESALIADPARFQERIRTLFRQVRDSLAEELNGGGSLPGPENGKDAPPSVANGHGANGTNGYHKNGNGNGHHGPGTGHGKGNGNGNGHTPRPATPSQISAIYAIARHRCLDLLEALRPRFQADRPEDLTLQQASQLIDDLKSSPSAEGN